MKTVIEEVNVEEIKNCAEINAGDNPWKNNYSLSPEAGYYYWHKIFFDDEVAGYFLVANWLDGSVELHRLYILQNFRKKKIATDVVDWLAKELKQLGFSSFWIEMREGSEFFWSTVANRYRCDIDSDRMWIYI